MRMNQNNRGRNPALVLDAARALDVGSVDDGEHLTDTQITIVRLLAKGFNDREIAKKLGMTHVELFRAMQEIPHLRGRTDILRRYEIQRVRGRSVSLVHIALNKLLKLLSHPDPAIVLGASKLIIGSVQRLYPKVEINENYVAEHSQPLVHIDLSSASAAQITRALRNCNRDQSVPVIRR